MGPQLDSCGRTGRDGKTTATNVLQWGRNLTVAEGAKTWMRKYLASLLQWGRNLTVAEGGLLEAAQSIRPVSFNGAAT